MTIEPEWRDAVLRIARSQAETSGCDALVVVLETLFQDHTLDAYVVRALHASILVSNG